jgi:hypothetical protein
MFSIFRSSAAMHAAVMILSGVAACAPASAQTRLQLQIDTQVTPQMRAEAMAIMQACRADYDRLCKDVIPGGGRIMACLWAHAGELSPGCMQAIPEAERLRDHAIAAGIMPK